MGRGWLGEGKGEWRGFGGTWLTLVKLRPSQCTCNTPSLTSHVHGSKHGSSTSSSELSTSGVWVEVGVGVGECDAQDRRAHPRTSARETHCILPLLPLSSTAWGYGPASARYRTAKQGTAHTCVYTHTLTQTHTRARRRRAKEPVRLRRESQLRMNQIDDTSQAY